MIIRTARKEHFTVIDNRMLEDDRLSFKAKGVLAFLLSRPDNWTANENHLATIGPDGSSAMRSALVELKDAGYLVAERKRADDGTFRWDHYIYDKPQTERPHVENPQAVDPQAEDRPITNTEETNTEKQDARGDSDYEHLRDDPDAIDLVAQRELHDRQINQAVATVRKFWETNMATVLTPDTAERIRHWVTEYGAVATEDAIRQSISRKAYNAPAYVAKILKSNKANAQIANGGAAAETVVGRNGKAIRDVSWENVKTELPDYMSE